MDKETLSNYGWIVIAVLVLAVMIALASPFGHFIENGVKSTAQGLFDVNQSAGAIAGLDIPDQTIAEPSEGGNGGSGGGINLNPDDGSTPADGDTYEYGDFIYTYQTSSNGWSVSINTAVTDKNQATYGAILESINGEPVTSLSQTFYQCTVLTTAPTIPSSVTNMYRTFENCASLTTAPTIPSGVTNINRTFFYCTSLTTAPVIPSSVTSLGSTFWGCTSLVTAPTIPSSVTNMSSTFYECTSLTTAPAIPSSVTNMRFTFGVCTSLTGRIEINADDLSSYDYCFDGTVQSITLTGTCPQLSELAATSSGNVTVQ